MDIETLVPFIVSFGILIAGAIDDIRTRKIHNKLVIICLVVALFSMLLSNGWSSLATGFMASFAALALTLPFVLAKALGAGDMKLLMAYAFTSTWGDIFWIVMYSFIWGAILGVFKALIDRQGLALLQNTFFLLKRQPPVESELHKIPFSVALLLAALTLWTLKGLPGGNPWTF